MSEFSKILKKIMALKGVTAYQIEKDTGGKISQSGISRILKGDREPRPSTVKKLADYFGLTVAQILGEEPLPTKKPRFILNIDTQTCPKGTDPECWARTPAVITEIEINLMNAFYRERDGIPFLLRTAESNKCGEKLEQYLYRLSYCMMLEITKEEAKKESYDLNSQ